MQGLTMDLKLIFWKDKLWIFLDFLQGQKVNFFRIFCKNYLTHNRGLLKDFL